MLRLDGVEPKPGATTVAQGVGGHVQQAGIYSIRSAIEKAAKIHDIISELRLDLLLLADTWIHDEKSPVATHNDALVDYKVVHKLRAFGSAGAAAVQYQDVLGEQLIVSDFICSGADSSVDTQHGRYAGPTRATTHLKTDTRSRQSTYLTGWRHA